MAIFGGAPEERKTSQLMTWAGWLFSRRPLFISWIMPYPFPHGGFFRGLGLRGHRVCGAGMCQCAQKPQLKCRLGAVQARDVGLGHTGGVACGRVDRKGPCNPWLVSQGLPCVRTCRVFLFLSLPTGSFQRSLVGCRWAALLGVIDSFNLSPMKVSSLPQALDIKSCKGYLPQFLDAAQNQSYVGPLLPP